MIYTRRNLRILPPLVTVTTTLTQLRRVCSTTIGMDYGFDGKTPFLRERALNLWLVQRIPGYRFDAYKPLRAAAFAGVLVSVTPTVEEIESLADRLSTLMSR